MVSVKAHCTQHPTCACIPAPWPKEGENKAMSQRPRFQGDSDALVCAIAPFVTSPGWLHYAEKLTAKRDQTVLVAQKCFIAELTKLNPTLNFTKELLTTVFRQLAKEKQFEELKTESSVDDWVSTMDLRTRTLCRHMNQARIPKPKWLIHIDGAADGVPPGQDQGGQASSSSSAAGNQQQPAEQAGASPQGAAGSAAANGDDDQAPSKPTGLEICCAWCCLHKSQLVPCICWGCGTWPCKGGRREGGKDSMGACWNTIMLCSSFPKPGSPHKCFFHPYF